MKRPVYTYPINLQYKKLVRRFKVFPLVWDTRSLASMQQPFFVVPKAVSLPY